MWRMNTVPNIDVCRSMGTKSFRVAISSTLQQLQDPVIHRLIHMICPAMTKNIQRLTLSLRGHPDEAIAQHADWPPPGYIWIRCLKHQNTGGKLIQISMITTPTKWRLAIHFGSRKSPTGGVNRRKRTQSTPIFPMWRATYSLSFHMVWRPVAPLAEMLSAGGSQKPQAFSSWWCGCI